MTHSRDDVTGHDDTLEDRHNRLVAAYMSMLDFVECDDCFEAYQLDLERIFGVMRRTHRPQITVTEIRVINDKFIESWQQSWEKTPDDSNTDEES